MERRVGLPGETSFPPGEGALFPEDVAHMLYFIIFFT